jgi:hypothetical protein
MGPTAASTAQAPQGFSVLADSPEEAVISYRTRGMGCMLTFIAFVVLAILGPLAWPAFRNPQGFLAAVRGLAAAQGWWTLLPLLGMLTAVAVATGYLIFHLFGRTVFTLRQDSLAVTRRLFGLSWTTTVWPEEMGYLEQVKDGGEDDSFHSWGLHLRGRRNVTLLARQRIDKSDWLGQRVAQFYHLEFRPCPKRQ